MWAARVSFPVMDVVHGLWWLRIGRCRGNSSLRGRTGGSHGRRRSPGSATHEKRWCGISGSARSFDVFRLTKLWAAPSSRPAQTSAKRVDEILRVLGCSPPGALVVYGNAWVTAE